MNAEIHLDSNIEESKSSCFVVVCAGAGEPSSVTSADSVALKLSIGLV